MTDYVTDFDPPPPRPAMSDASYRLCLANIARLDAYTPEEKISAMSRLQDQQDREDERRAWREVAARDRERKKAAK